MKRINLVVLVLLAAMGMVNAAGNTSGWADYTRVTTICTTGVTAWSSVSELSEYEDVRLLLKVNDSTAAGFASDSVSLAFGYRTGVETLNGSGVRDTLWDDPILIDTLSASAFGTLGSGLAASDGSMDRTWAGADTLSVTGFATVSRWIIPEWDGLIKFYVTGLAANKKGAPLVLIIEPRRRIGARVR